MEKLDELEKELIFKVLSWSSSFCPKKLEGQRFHKGQRCQSFSCRGGGWAGLEETFCKIIVCSTETMTSARIRHLGDFKRQPTKKIAEGLVPTSVVFQMQRAGGWSHSLLSHFSNSQKVIPEPQPSAANLYPAVSSCWSQCKAGGRCPVAGPAAGEVPGQQTGGCQPFKGPGTHWQPVQRRILRDVWCPAAMVKTSQLGATFPILYLATEHGPLPFWGELVKLVWKSALTALSVASQKAEVSLCVFQFTFCSLYKCHTSNWWFNNANSNFKGTWHGL